MSTNKLNVARIRKEFPSLRRKHRKLPMIYLDGPAGTQVPQSVIKSISKYYTRSNANTRGSFVTTQETDSIIEETRKAVAALLGAEDGETISIGQNMTTL